MTKARDLANIISGGFTADDIPNIDTAKITSGTFVDARLPATALNSNVDLTTLSASNLTSGTVATARLGTGTASSSTFLRGDGSFATPVGGANTPAFLASSSGEVAVANITDTKISNYSVEILDTDNNFASSRFTPQTAGYYFIFGVVASYPVWTASNYNPSLKKNGTSFVYTSNYVTSYPQSMVSGMVYLNGSSDYVEVFLYQNSGSTRQVDGGTHRIFGGYKIIT